MFSSSILFGLCHLSLGILAVKNDHLPGSLIQVRQNFNSTSVSGSQSANDVLNKGITALGGETALKTLKTVSYHANQYRSKSLAESEVPLVADIGIATTGQQTISYEFTDLAALLQRLDRYNMVGDYWTFYRSQLQPIDVTIVTKSGSEGYACYTKGNTHLFSPPNGTAGYVDAAYADILVRDSLRLSPVLVLAFKSLNSSLSFSEVYVNSVGPHPAVTDTSTNLTIIFDPHTFLPTRVRAYEEHQVFGQSTSDFVLYNYTEIDGIKFPRNFKLLYNEDKMLIEMLVDSINVNPVFEATFFNGLSASEVNSTFLALPSTAPQQSLVYTPAEVFESSQNMLWYGAYPGTLPKLQTINPIPSLPNLYHLTFADDVSYTTTLAVFDNAIMVTDAPAHQSKLVIRYVQETFNRSVTHLLVTHHHHDHNYGASDYVAIGAKLVVPEQFTYYWDNIPNVQFATATETQPFTHKDANLQVRGVWHEVNAHSADWMYFTFTAACPGPYDPMGVVTADAWSPGIYPWDYEQTPVVQWLAIAKADGVARGNLALPIHGQPTNPTELYDVIGYEYPDHKTTDFLPGGPWC